MKKIILFLGMCICLISLASAYSGVTVSVTISDKDDVNVDFITDYVPMFEYGSGYRYIFYGDDGKIAKSGFLAIEFWSDVEKLETAQATISVEDDDIGELVIYNPDDEEIFREDIGELMCNNDGECSGFENYDFCSDCGAGAEDDYCNYERDNICDPDCGAMDVDCSCGNEICDQNERYYVGSCPEDCEYESGTKSSYWYVWIIVIVAVVLAVGFLFLRKNRRFTRTVRRRRYRRSRFR